MSTAITRKMAYVINSLEDQRARLQLKHRKLVSRHSAMKRSGHPDLLGQAYLIDVNARLIHVVHEALSRAEIAQKTGEEGAEARSAEPVQPHPSKRSL